MLSDTLVDVLVGSMFTQSDPPRSSLGGLFRFFSLLTTFDWAKRPLIVNLDEPYQIDFSLRQRADASMFKLREHRRGGPPLVVYVLTGENSANANPEGELTLFPPVKQVDKVSWQRITQRAALSKAYLEKLCSQDAAEDPQVGAFRC